MNRHIAFLTFVVILSFFFLAGCQPALQPFECKDTIGCVVFAPGEPIKLGVIQDLSDGAAAFGLDQLRGIELALDRHDYKLLGHPIELQTEDEQCTAEGGANAALRIIADPKIIAVLGTTCSVSAMPASEMISEAGLIMVSGSNSAASLTSIGQTPGSDWQLGYFRTAMNDVMQSQAAALFVYNELGITRVATVNDGDSYTRGLTDMFQQVFTGLGGEIVLDITVNKGDKDMQPVLKAIENVGVELIFLPLFAPEGNLLIRQVRAMPEFSNTILMGASGLLTEVFVEDIGSDGTGMYFVTVAKINNAAFSELTSAYISKYGESPPTTTFALAYDASNLVLHAIESAAIQQQDGTLYVGRDALRDNLYRVSGFEGVTGRLSCNEFGDCAVGEVNIVRLDDPRGGIDGLKSNVIYTYNLKQMEKP